LDGRLDAASNTDDVNRVIEDSCGSALLLAQAIVSSRGPQPGSLIYATRGVHAAVPGDAPSVPSGAPLWGFASVVALEHPELRCACVDLDAAGAADDDIARLADTLLADDRESQIAIRRGRRLVMRIAQTTTHADATAPLCRADATYLVTGGVAGIGLQVAAALVDQGARHLVLTARRAPSPEADAAFDALRARGAQVAVAAVDVSDREAMARLLDGIDADGAPLAGVIHCAGVVDDGALLQQTWTRFRTVMAAKVAGAWHLHALTRSRPLDFFALFSSTASIVGHAGQANYAAANAFLDALAHHRRAHGLPALAVNWGPWSGAGLAVRSGLLDRARAQGVGAIDPAHGLQALVHLLRARTAQAVVLRADWPTLLASFQGRPPAVLQRFERSAPHAAVDARPALHVELAAAPPHLRWPMLLEHVRGESRAVLGVEHDGDIDPQQGLRDLGFDSLMAVELRNRLQRSVGRSLPATLALDCPTVDAIARKLAEEFDVEPPQAAGAQETRVARAGDVLMDIEQLSEDEVDRMFANRLQGVPGTGR